MTGELKPEADWDPVRRSFYELRNDPERWQAFYSGPSERQRREHPDVQAWVAGQQ